MEENALFYVCETVSAAKCGAGNAGGDVNIWFVAETLVVSTSAVPFFTCHAATIDCERVVNTNTPRIQVALSENLSYLRMMKSESVDLIYIDPPFNTGRKQIRKRFHTEDDEKIDEASYGYEDSYEDFIGFLEPRMCEAYRILKPQGSLFFHLDYREIHYCKVMLDRIFGRESFINEIIWAYDYGARSKKKWSAKHDNILWYAKDPKNYTFNYDEMDRIPYMAPGLVGPEKAARGKTPTDVWWHTIVSPNSHEKTGYATQKPRGIIDRIVKIHSNRGDVVMDFFAGSGTLGESAYVLGRNSILVDCNEDAIAVMKRRFEGLTVDWIRCDGVQAVEPFAMRLRKRSEIMPSSASQTEKKRGRSPKTQSDSRQMEMF